MSLCVLNHKTQDTFFKDAHTHTHIFSDRDNAAALGPFLDELLEPPRLRRELGQGLVNHVTVCTAELALFVNLGLGEAPETRCFN